MYVFCGPISIDMIAITRTNVFHTMQSISIAYFTLTIFHFAGYLDRCKRDKDKTGIGKAHEALARCQQRYDLLDMSISTVYHKM